MALRAFAGLPDVSVESPVLLAQAPTRAEKGMDFADALHLGAPARCDAMLTFDRQFINLARDTPIRVTEPRNPLELPQRMSGTRHEGHTTDAWYAWRRFMRTKGIRI